MENSWPYQPYSHLKWGRFRSDKFAEKDLYVLPKEELQNAQPSRKGRVCVIGGGVSGLTAALELARAGFGVTVLEGGSRWGGRILTHRFTNGDYAELGAMRIPENHAGVLSYIKEFKLTTKRFVQKNDRALFLIRGSVARACDVKHSAQLFQGDPLYANGRPPLDLVNFREMPLPLGDTTRNPDLVLTALGRQLAETLKDPDWLAAYGVNDLTGADSVRRYQQLALWQYVSGTSDPRPSPRLATRRGAPVSYSLEPDQWEYIGRLTSHIWLEKISLLQWLLDGTEIMNGPMLRIDGGMQKLVDGFINSLNDLGSNLHLKATVLAIEISEEDKGGPVSIIWDDGTGSHQRQAFDFAVVAVPAPAAARIRYKPSLDREQYHALTNLTYLDMAKSAVSCSRRRWESDPFRFAGGASFTDLPIQQIWYPSDNAEQVDIPIGSYTASNVSAIQEPSSQDVESTYWEPQDLLKAEYSGALLTYLWGPNAKRFAAMTDTERRRTVVTGLESLHPGIKDDILDVQYATWNSSDCGGGAFAMFAPGEQERYAHLLGRPHPADPKEARVFFAGEHLAVMHGWIQSAIQSGIAAVLNIFTSPRLR